MLESEVLYRVGQSLQSVSGETRFMGAKADLLAEALAEFVLEVPLSYRC
jgi:hypothetical protein